MSFARNSYKIGINFLLRAEFVDASNFSCNRTQSEFYWRVKWVTDYPLYTEQHKKNIENKLSNK